MHNNKKYIYPKLDANYDLAFIRIGGSGLANCMFVAARAWIIKHQMNREFIDPTWGKFSIGTYIRREKDKRHYFGLFKPVGTYGIKKIFLLAFYKKNSYDNNNSHAKIITVSGLGNYFKDLIEHQSIVNDFFKQCIKQKHLKKIEKHNFSYVIGVHVRLGDFPDEIRIDINWYRKIILDLNKRLNEDYKIYVFSDGTDRELEPITSIANVKKVFFGNALCDILALSKCKLIIGSHSTFSGWGAFLGQVPTVFSKRQFGNVLADQNFEFVLGDNYKCPQRLINLMNNKL